MVIGEKLTTRQQVHGGFMKSVPVVLSMLAVLYSLLMLVLVESTRDSGLANNQERVSEVVLEFVFKR